MSKMGELAQELAELKRCAETLISISETLTEMFSRADEPEEKSEVKAPVKEAKKEAKPVAKKELKLTDVRAVLAEKSRAGFTKEVKELLIKHGACDFFLYGSAPAGCQHAKDHNQCKHKNKYSLFHALISVCYRYP